MEADALQSLANAFHAAAEQMRQPPPQIFAPNGHPVLSDPAQDMTRSIAADVLKAIGDVYLGQAVQHA